MVTAYDFMLRGLDKAGDTSNMLGFNVTPASVMELPGLNTLGISMVRIDFATPLVLVPPHIHPRATEILVVIEGTLSVGFITTNNTLIPTNLEKGDVFVFPKGLVHFQLNIASFNAVARIQELSWLPTHCSGPLPLLMTPFWPELSRSMPSLSTVSKTNSSPPPDLISSHLMTSSLLIRIDLVFHSSSRSIQFSWYLYNKKDNEIHSIWTPSLQHHIYSTYFCSQIYIYIYIYA